MPKIRVKGSNSPSQYLNVADNSPLINDPQYEIAPSGSPTEQPATPKKTVIYNNDGSRDVVDEVDEYYKTNKPLSAEEWADKQDSIKNDYASKIQASIDSINASYVPIYARAEREANERLGSTATINALAGQRGAPSGAATTEKTTQYNKAQVEGIDADKAKEIDNINRYYQGLEQKEIKYQNDLRREDANKWIDYMAGDKERKQTQSKAKLEDILNTGVDFDSLDESLQQEYADLFGYGLGEAKKSWDYKIGQALVAKEEANKKISLENAKTEAETNKINSDLKKPIEVSPGASIYDPETGKFIGTAPEKPADPKDNTITVGNTLLQYNSQTGNWESIYTAPSSVKNSIVKINGTDYQVDEEGNLSTPKVPKSEVGQLKSDALTSAKQLLEKFKAGNKLGVGGSSIIPVIPGTKTADFVNQFDNLKSLLSLDNVKYLKGQGQVSDAERKLLAEASTKLNRNQSEDEFEKTLEDIVKSLSGTESGSGTTKTKEELRAEFPQATPEEIEALFQEEQGFSKVGGDTNKAVSYLGNYGAITSDDNGSPYWKYGLDVDLKKGDPVFSPVDGVVVQSGDKKDGFGNRVGIKTAKGNIVYLSHNDSLDVKVGDTVKSGQKVASGGNSGRTIALNGGDGSHLDITVKKLDGTYYLPEEIRKILS